MASELCTLLPNAAVSGVMLTHPHPDDGDREISGTDSTMR
jgi:hypothetical protein